MEDLEHDTGGMGESSQRQHSTLEREILFPRGLEVMLALCRGGNSLVPVSRVLQDMHQLFVAFDRNKAMYLRGIDLDLDLDRAKNEFTFFTADAKT